MSRTK